MIVLGDVSCLDYFPNMFVSHAFELLLDAYLPFLSFGFVLVVVCSLKIFEFGKAAFDACYSANISYLSLSRIIKCVKISLFVVKSG